VVHLNLIRWRICHESAHLLTASLATALVAGDETSPTRQDSELTPALALKPSVTVFTQLSAGWQHACVLRSDGVVQCWGNNSDGQAPATRSAATGSFVDLSAAVEFSCAVRSDGVVECWGKNDHGQAPSTRSPSTGSFVQVSGGAVHACALRNDGVAECWGGRLWRSARNPLRDDGDLHPERQLAVGLERQGQLHAAWPDDCNGG
jgi:alpha-tubulin suppressor-like RCC1 family protein